MNTNTRYQILLIGLFFFYAEQLASTKDNNENEPKNKKQAELKLKCTHLHGENLMNCMRCLTAKELIYNLFYLNQRALSYYLNRLEQLDFEEFENNYDNDELRNKIIAFLQENEQFDPQEIEKTISQIKEIKNKHWWSQAKARQRNAIPIMLQIYSILH